MATFTVGTTPVQLVRGRPFALPMTWQTADEPPVPINITAFSFAGTIVWTQSDGDVQSPEAADLTFTTTDAANGEFTVSLDAASTPQIPDGAVSATMGVTLTDGSGNTYDFAIPVTASTPPGVAT